MVHGVVAVHQLRNVVALALAIPSQVSVGSALCPYRFYTASVNSGVMTRPADAGFLFTDLLPPWFWRRLVINAGQFCCSAVPGRCTRLISDAQTALWAHRCVQGFWR